MTTLSPLPALDRRTCRMVRLVTVVPDEHRCRAVLRTLLDRAYRRWAQHGEPEAFPPLRHWRAVDVAAFPVAGAPERLIVAAAEGRRVAARDLAGMLAAALMLHTGCPTIVDSVDVVERAAVTGGEHRRGLLITVYGLDDDDLAFAGDLLTLLLVAADAVPLHRGDHPTAVPPDDRAARRDTVRAAAHYIRAAHAPGCVLAPPG